MGEAKKRAVGRAVLLRLLLRPLGGADLGCGLQAEAVFRVVAARLCSHGARHRMDRGFSMGIDVPFYGEGWQIKGERRRATSGTLKEERRDNVSTDWERLWQGNPVVVLGIGEIRPLKQIKG